MVIFDFDGVIFDSWQSNYKIIKFISKFTNYNEEQIQKMWGMRGESFIKIITNKISWPINYFFQKIIYWTWRLKEISKNSEAKFFNNTLRTCKTLKNNGYLVGILTNRVSKTLKAVLKKLPNPPDYYFDFIQTHELSNKRVNLNCKNHICSKYSKPEIGAFVDFYCNFLFKELEKNIGNNNFCHPKLELVYVGDTLTDFEFIKNINEKLSHLGFKIKFFGVLTGPLNNKEKWIQWSNNEVSEENILKSTSELTSKLLNKLKTPS